MSQIVLVIEGCVQLIRQGDQAAADARNAARNDLDKSGTWHPATEIIFCVDCGMVGQRIGHMGCQFPQDHP